MAQGPRAGVGELSPAQGADARPGPAHGLRGSELPEHRRVLAPRHRHVHDPRRHLHALVRLLQRHARHARRRRPARAGQVASAIHAMELDYVVITSVDRDDLPDCGASHFAATIRETRARIAAVPDRGPDSRFQGRRGGAADRARRRTGRPQPQHRDGAAPLSHGAAGRPLRARAAAARSLAHLRAAHSRPSRA